VEERCARHTVGTIDKKGLMFKASRPCLTRERDTAAKTANDVPQKQERKNQDRQKATDYLGGYE